jgi:hypothetical protein
MDLKNLIYLNKYFSQRKKYSDILEKDVMKIYVYYIIEILNLELQEFMRYL